MQVSSVLSKSFPEPWTFFLSITIQTAWGGRKGVCKTKPDMQQSAVKGPLCWSHCSASELMLCFPNKSQVLKEQTAWSMAVKGLCQEGGTAGHNKRNMISFEGSCSTSRRVKPLISLSIMRKSSGEENASKWGWFPWRFKNRILCSWGFKNDGHSRPFMSLADKHTDTNI